MRKSTNILSLLFISFAIFSLADAAKRLCTSNIISQTPCPTDFENMCAFFSGENCNTNICVRLTSNDCTACLDDSILFYTTDPCNNEQVFCDPNSVPVDCPGKLTRTDIVCGHFSDNCSGDSCFSEYPSSCHACQDTQVEYFVPGLCPGQTEQSPQTELILLAMLNEEDSGESEESSGEEDLGEDMIF